MIEEEIFKGILEKDKEHAFVYLIEEMAEPTKELSKTLEGRGNLIKIERRFL